MSQEPYFDTDIIESDSEPILIMQSTQQKKHPVRNFFRILFSKRYVGLGRRKSNYKRHNDHGNTDLSNGGLSLLSASGFRGCLAKGSYVGRKRGDAVCGSLPWPCGDGVYTA